MESYSVTVLPITESLFIFFALAGGLTVGSFLNVVIVRLPLMMEHAWEQACAEHRGEATQALGRFNLAVPRSHCPSCKQMLGWRELIPVLSWLWQRGKCRHCGARIPVMYPLVELATAALFVGSAWQLGPTPAALAAMVLTAALLALAVIDFRTMLLPDVITQPLMWAGILFSLTGHGFTDLRDSVLGAAAGYLTLWAVANGYRLVRRKEGMGQGDFKLLALLGAWLGWQALPLIVLAASLLGVMAGFSLIVARRAQHDTPLPFGPCLALAGVAVLFLPIPLL